MPEAATPMALLGLIERLEAVRLSCLEAARGHRVHQVRLAQLVREASRTTVQNVAGFERQRRQATLVAVSFDLAADLTDKAIELFDRLIGAMLRKAEARRRDFQGHQREGAPLRERQSWLRLSEQSPANDKWSVCRLSLECGLLEL